MIIRRCREDDIPRLFEIFKDVYAANPRLQERDYFDWQFRDTPFDQDREHKFWILWDGLNIRGFLGFVPIEFKYDGQISRGAWTMNWHTIGENASGLQLLTRYMKDHDNRFLIGLSPVSVSIYKAYRIPLLAALPRWVGIMNPDRVASLFSIQHPENKEKLGVGHKTLMRHTDTTGISPCARFNDDEEFHWSSWPSVRGYIRRTGVYLNWRYIDIPHHNYRAIRGPEGQFAVYRIETVKGFEECVIRLVEWNFAGIWAERALASILQQGLRSAAILVDFFCTAGAVGSSLVQLGFLPESSFQTEPIPYLFRPICHTDGIQLAIDLPPHRRERHLDFNAWNITKGDSDIDRVKL